MANLTVRYLYEIFFEIILCVTINVGFAYQGNDMVKYGYLLSIVLIILITLVLILMSLQICMRGPRVEGSFEKSSCSRSCWGYRPLRTEQVELWSEKLD